ncbi:MAG: hypothetical protein RL220_1251 [Bacteroidota bacterium]
MWDNALITGKYGKMEKRPTVDAVLAAQASVYSSCMPQLHGGDIRMVHLGRIFLRRS